MEKCQIEYGCVRGHKKLSKVQRTTKAKVQKIFWRKKPIGLD